MTYTPERWAFEITLLLNAVFGTDRFPIDIPSIARDYTAQKFPKDPIISVQGDALPGFEGGLFRAPSGKGWGVIYNSAIRSKGRINFTLAHEFGHYLLHRTAHPNGFQCGQQDFVRWDSEYGQIEHQANVFAANFLMPLDDFRRQIPAKTRIDLDMISHCIDRYRVSFVATVLRWLSYTEKRAVLVVSRDGFILWARSSEAALKTGAFFRTSAGPIEIPSASLPASPNLLFDGQGGVDHEEGVWFREPVREMTIVAEHYDFAASLLLLDDSPALRPFEVEDDDGDTFDRLTAQEPRREW
jgi:hypothetical protein